MAGMAPVYAEECRVSEWTIVCLEPGARPHFTLDGLQFSFLSTVFSAPKPRGVYFCQCFLDCSARDLPYC